MIEGETLSLDAVEAGRHYKNCYFSSASQPIRLSDVTFERCEFQQTDFENSEWLDCRLIHLNLSNHSLNSSVFYRCVFEKCQLTGTNFYFNHWKNNQVIESKANYLNLSESALENCSFTDCFLPDSYFQSVKIKKTLAFIRCELEEADFFDTPLKGVDFSKSIFSNLRVSPNQLKGCIINPYQAASLIQLLGVKIKD